MTHRNARLTPVTRAELVEQVLVGWPQVEVARLFRGTSIPADGDHGVGIEAAVGPHRELSPARPSPSGYGGSAKADRTRSLTAPAVPCAAPARPISCRKRPSVLHDAS